MLDQTITLHALATVTGGNGPKPPVQPVIPNFGGSRFSADWWKQFNNSDAGKIMNSR
jgi:hypothetical protein